MTKRRTDSQSRYQHTKKRQKKRLLLFCGVWQLHMLMLSKRSKIVQKAQAFSLRESHVLANKLTNCFVNDTRPGILRHVTVAAQYAFKGLMTH